jgi:thiamine kinase-like enzyme
VTDPPNHTGGMDDEQELAGGVANAGAVRRVGSEVVRPSNAHTPTIHALLHHVRERGFDGASEPLRLDSAGREWLTFIPGDVPTPPFPAWSQTDAVLASTAALLRRFHDATLGFTPPTDASWDTELADPQGAEVICHNDVCPENVVYRDARAVALLDFDFAAPGRRIFDLAALASMCVPIDLDEDAARTGRAGLDPFTRLRVVADAYDLPAGRHELVQVLGERIAGGGGFVRRRVEAGIPAFVAMWHMMGGEERLERRRRWFESSRQRFLDEVG